jgi:hypothetical protein
MTARKGAGPGSAATDLEARETVGIGNAAVSKAKSSERQAAPKSWRDVLPIHPAADLFPLMAPDELKALGEDIKKNGLKIPIVFCLADDGKGKLLLDGRNRLDAMELIGRKLVNRRDELALDPMYLHGLANDDDPYAFVISINIRRRHLTTDQKRELIAKLIKATPEKSDRQIAETAKASPTTVGTVRAEMEAKGDVSKLDTRTDSKGRQQPAKKTTTPQRAGHGRHVCWQCQKWGAVGEVEQHEFEAYCGTDVWLHPACVAAFRLSLEHDQKSRDDIGENSAVEATRKDARIEELQAEKRRLEIENVGLRSEVEVAKSAARPVPESKSASRCSICREKKQARAARVFVCDLCAEIHELETTANPAPPADDGLDIPPWLRRAAP